MKRNRINRILGLLAGLLVIAAALTAGVALGRRNALPFNVISHYSTELLYEEARTMGECADCHEAEKFHRCTTCHDDHGAVEFSEVPFFALVAWEGDVPEPGFIRLNDILPYRDQPHTYLALLELLAQQGVEQFESVTLASNDGGFITLDPENLNDNALLLPYADGIRFACEDLHVSTWLKGITRIIVVGPATPLTIDGQATSMGRLLLGPTQAVTVEQTEVMFASESDGQVRRAKTASRLEGAPINILLSAPGFSSLVITDGFGGTHTLSAAEAEGAVLVQLRSGAALALPGRGRSQWIENVVALESKG